jgi:RNA ligase (TIGR02306 family)
MERKLASIQEIAQIDEIPGADNIQVATVKGWKLVVKRDEFKAGDKAVYCEIDSFLPIKEEFEFLRKSSYKKMGELEGFRLKTIKLRGQVSQGLLLPISILRDKIYLDQYKRLTVGDDVAETLGIFKYEPPIPAELSGVMKGNFPAFIPKTDEERVQNLTEVYENFKKSNFYVTEKLDGSSATYYMNNGVFGTCSRNIDLLESADNTFWKVARSLALEEKMKESEKNIGLQGELIGEGIKGNPYKLKGQTVRFFNAFDIDEQRYLTLDEFGEVMDLFNLDTVPFVTIEYKLPETIDELLLFAEGKSMLQINTEREGVVIRNHARTISFKVISNKFLLKQD